MLVLFGVFLIAIRFNLELQSGGDSVPESTNAFVNIIPLDVVPEEVTLNVNVLSNTAQGTYILLLITLQVLNFVNFANLIRSICDIFSTNLLKIVAIAVHIEQCVFAK